MISWLKECCCEVLDPCSSRESIVIRDGWNDDCWFTFYVHDASTHFEVVYYTSLCNVDTTLLNFNVNKAVGVTSDTVSETAYDKILTCQHFVSDFYAYREGWSLKSNSADICSQVIGSTYTCKNIKDFYRTSSHGGFCFEQFIHQVKKNVPYSYVLPAPAYPVGCENFA